MSDPEHGTPLLQETDPTVMVEQEHWTRRTARQVHSFTSNLGTSVVFGILSAFGFKTLGRSVLIAIVLLFLGFQVLAFYGFVNIKAVGGAVARRFDLNSDGRVNAKDVTYCCHRVALWALSFGLPSTIGFCLGFWFGWRVL